MKSLILITLVSLFVFSCGKDVSIQGEQNTFPNSSLNSMNINGDIKSIKEVEYEASLSDDLEVDITLAKKGEITFFNEDGYLIKGISCDTNGIHVNCDKNESYIITYNKDYNLLLKEVYNINTSGYETSISNIYSDDGVLIESYTYLGSSIYTYSKYTYYEDTGLLKLIVTDAFNDGVNLNMSFQNSYIYNDDGSLDKEGSNFNNIDTVTYYEYNTVKKLKIKNKFRIEYGDEFDDIREVELSLIIHEDNKLVREDLNLDTSSKLFVTYEYDENGNLVDRMEVDKNDHLVKRDRYNYKYNSDNNWIEKRTYNKDGELYILSTRKYTKF